MKKIRQNNVLLERDDESLYEEFHANTKLDRYGARQFGERIGQFSAVPQVVSETRESFKNYSGLDRILLPFNALPKLARGALSSVLVSRRTQHPMPGAVPIAWLSAILFGASIKGSSLDQLGLQKTRLYPSAGALYPLEVYVLAMNVKSVPKAVYHYSPSDHSITRIAEIPEGWRFGDVFFVEGDLGGCGFLIVISSVFARNTSKYGDRGYRMILFEAGHLAQNFLLISGALKASSLPIGGFNEQILEELIGIDGVEESAIYPILFGNSP